MAFYASGAPSSSTLLDVPPLPAACDPVLETLLLSLPYPHNVYQRYIDRQAARIAAVLAVTPALHGSDRNIWTLSLAEELKPGIYCMFYAPNADIRVPPLFASALVEYLTAEDSGRRPALESVRCNDPRIMSCTFLWAGWRPPGSIDIGDDRWWEDKMNLKYSTGSVPMPHPTGCAQRTKRAHSVELGSSDTRACKRRAIEVPGDAAATMKYAFHKAKEDVDISSMNPVQGCVNLDSDKTHAATKCEKLCCSSDPINDSDSSLEYVSVRAYYNAQAAGSQAAYERTNRPVKERSQQIDDAVKKFAERPFSPVSSVSGLSSISTCSFPSHCSPSSPLSPTTLVAPSSSPSPSAPSCTATPKPVAKLSPQAVLSKSAKKISLPPKSSIRPRLLRPKLPAASDTQPSHLAPRPTNTGRHAGALASRQWAIPPETTPPPRLVFPSGLVAPTSVAMHGEPRRLPFTVIPSAIPMNGARPSGAPQSIILPRVPVMASQYPMKQHR